MGCLCSKLYDKSRSFHLKRWSNNKFEKYRLRDEGSPKSEFTAIAPAHNSVARQNAASSRVSKPADKPAAAVKKKEEKKTYSWDKKPRLDPKDFMCMNIEGEEVCKQEGQINGQQFVIDNCKRSKIFVFDHCASVTIDDCVDCLIFIGPVESSIFIRNCQNCNCVFLSRQLRTRDCDSCNFKLFCATRPVIENSKQLGFGCFDCTYANLPAQLGSAKLSVYNNYWSNVYDFTPSAAPNWHFLEDTLEDLLKDDVTRYQKSYGVLGASPGSSICKTRGERPCSDSFHFLVLFQLDDEAESIHLLHELKEKGSLVHVNAAKLTHEEIEELDIAAVEISGHKLQANARKVVGIELSSNANIRGELLDVLDPKYSFTLVDNFDVIKAFRYKGITG